MYQGRGQVREAGGQPQPPRLPDPHHQLRGPLPVPPVRGRGSEHRPPGGRFQREGGQGGGAPEQEGDQPQCQLLEW